MNSAIANKFVRVSRSRGKVVSLVVLCCALQGCGGDGSQAPIALVATPAVGYACPSVTELAGSTPVVQAISPLSPPRPVVADLRLAAVSPISFARYDLASGMSYAYGFTVADFDCDSRVDIGFFDSFSGNRQALRVERGAIGLMQWNGGLLSRFTAADMYADLNQPTKPAQLFERPLAVDLNNDGRLDIVGAANASAAVVAYLNSGSRSVYWSRRALNSDLPGAVNVAIADMDGDNDKDIVVVMRESQVTVGGVRGVAWLENPGGTDVGWLRRQIGGEGVLADPRTLIVRDLDRDGRQDVVVGDASGGVSIFQRGADSRWQMRVIPGISSIHGHFGRPVDFDKDGETDLLQPTYLGITWLRNAGGGAAWQAIPVMQALSMEPIQVITEVDAGDIDLDGRVDIVFASGSLGSKPTDPRSGGVYWLRQQPDGWALYRIYADENAAVAIALVDYDADGDLDIVTNSEYQQNAVTLWLNDLRSTPRVW